MFYKRLIAAVPLKNSTPSFATGRKTQTTTFRCGSLHHDGRAF